MQLEFLLSELISIHTLHAESDGLASVQGDLAALFQSTLSMRRVTERNLDNGVMEEISIHTLHAESDP